MARFAAGFKWCWIRQFSLSGHRKWRRSAEEAPPSTYRWECLVTQPQGCIANLFCLRINLLLFAEQCDLTVKVSVSTFLRLIFLGHPSRKAASSHRKAQVILLRLPSSS